MLAGAALCKRHDVMTLNACAADLRRELRWEADIQRPPLIVM
jgi:hypothetical protein